ncbi:hypothetical protein M8494_18995 [Serratia ureilytica]
MAASGVSHQALITRLIELALERHQQDRALNKFGVRSLEGGGCRPVSHFTVTSISPKYFFDSAVTVPCCFTWRWRHPVFSFQRLIPLRRPKAIPSPRICRRAPPADEGEACRPAATGSRLPRRRYHQRGVKPTGRRSR